MWEASLSGLRSWPVKEILALLMSISIDYVFQRFVLRVTFVAMVEIRSHLDT